MSLITRSDDLETLKAAGLKLSEIIQFGTDQIKVGLNLLDLDQLIENEIIKNQCQPSFKGFEGYPNATCLSVNSEVVHSIPRDYNLQAEDVLGLDVGLWYKNICVDAATTIALKPVNQNVNKLLKITLKALNIAIKTIKSGIRVGDISATIQNVAEQNNLGIVKNLTGHGVGFNVHDHPSIPNSGQAGHGSLIKEGMVLAIEPMFTLGQGETRTSDDGWGVETVDHSLAAQFEHTVLVTNSGCQVMTKK